MGARFTVSTLVLAGYLLAARGVDLYPLSTFAMYADAPGDSMSRVMARTADGRLLEVTDLAGWQCDNLPHLEAIPCGARNIGYLDREREEWIRSHAGAGGEPVELVRRIFSFDGVTRPPTCTLARCTAVPR